MTRRVLFVGANGKLAKALADTLPAGSIGIGRSHAELDICDATQIAVAIADTRADLVVNGAAYNMVDRAESDGMEDCVRVNVLGPGRLSEACKQAGVPLIHFSTDLVFGNRDGRTAPGRHLPTPIMGCVGSMSRVGTRITAFVEDDPTGPLSVYGATKLAGENVVLAAGSANYVIRVCRLYGPSVDDRSVGNFPRLMLNLARERGRVKVVNDQVGCPSYTVDVAKAVWQLLDCAAPGLYHLCNSGEVTYAEYARSIFDIAGVDCIVEAVSTEAYGAPARRPLYSSLNCSKAYAAGVVPLRHWRDALEEYLSTD
jgi:dTDP-4-dehydrorhamnose reductase